MDTLSKTEAVAYRTEVYLACEVGEVYCVAGVFVLPDGTAQTVPIPIGITYTAAMLIC